MRAYLLLVAYNFGCNVSMSRVEPRLHLWSPAGPRQRKSYIPSNCYFVFQSPMSREAARAGLVYGPVAAVSARPTVDFSSPDVETAQSLDLAREVTAALIAAQHRAREGKEETRFGESQWWKSKRRWGGGSGGPIGREIDKYAVQGDKDTRPSGCDGMPMPVPKKPRKNMSIYGNYRMVRPPSSSWDRKAKYEAVGKVREADHDDIYVVSSLFHHVSMLPGSGPPAAVRRSGWCPRARRVEAQLGQGSGVEEPVVRPVRHGPEDRGDAAAVVRNGIPDEKGRRQGRRHHGRHVNGRPEPRLAGDADASKRLGTTSAWMRRWAAPGWPARWAIRGGGAYGPTRARAHGRIGCRHAFILCRGGEATREKGVVSAVVLPTRW